MKVPVGIIAVSVIAASLTFYFVSQQKEAKFSRERDALAAQWETEKAELEASLAGAKRRPAPGEQKAPASSAAVSGVIHGKYTADQILEQLTNFKVGSGAKRTADLRRVVHLMGSLADLAGAALPPIQTFLGRLVDVDYGVEDSQAVEAGAANNDWSFARPAVARKTGLNFAFPPSLRLGLVDVLHEIGGTEAEKILADMLSNTGRGVEVAYIAKTLQEMAPDKYRELALNAARELLKAPPAISNPDPLDQQAKEFLFQLLQSYRDTASGGMAQELLIGPDGKVDKTSLNYLASTLKEQSVGPLAAAFKDPRLTNMWDKASVASQVVAYAGTNQQANSFLKEVVADESIPAWVRAMTLQSMGGASFAGPSAPATTDPAQLQAQIDLLNRIPDGTEVRLAQARQDAIKRLTERLAARLAPPPAPAPIQEPIAAEPVLAVPATDAQQQ